MAHILDCKRGKNIRASFHLEEINKMAKYDLFNLIWLSEWRYTEQLQQVSKKIANNHATTKVILMSGPSASGKTTTSHLLCAMLAQKGIAGIVISLDNFFVERGETPKMPDGKFDFECLQAIDLPLLNQFVETLLKEKKATMPIFDFKAGSKNSWQEVVLKENDVIIFEGIHALNPQLLTIGAPVYKIYVCLNSNYMDAKKNVLIPAKSLRLLRRMNRDYYTRGYNPSQTFAMWENVTESEEIWIKPFKKTADYVIDTTHAYEPLLYVETILPLLKKNEGLRRADQLANMLSQCGKVSKKVVPPGSLLWEFIVE